jgi:hypothetical protein
VFSVIVLNVCKTNRSWKGGGIMRDWTDNWSWKEMLEKEGVQLKYKQVYIIWGDTPVGFPTGGREVQNVVIMLNEHHSMKTYCGSLGTAPWTSIRSVETRRKWRSASGDGWFTSLRKPHSTPRTLTSALLSTSSCGTQANMGDWATVTVITLNEIFAAPSQCAYSDGRDIKLTLFYFIKL